MYVQKRQSLLNFSRNIKLSMAQTTAPYASDVSMAQTTAPYASDVSMAMNFCDFYPCNTGVMMDSKTKQVVSLKINRPQSGVVEEENRIIIPVDTPEYEKLTVHSVRHAPFPVYAWDTSRRIRYRRGYFFMQYCASSNYFELHRTPRVLSDACGTTSFPDNDAAPKQKMKLVERNAISKALVGCASVKTNRLNLGSVRARIIEKNLLDKRTVISKSLVGGGASPYFAKPNGLNLGSVRARTTVHHADAEFKAQCAEVAATAAKTRGEATLARSATLCKDLGAKPAAKTNGEVEKTAMQVAAEFKAQCAARVADSALVHTAEVSFGEKAPPTKRARVTPARRGNPGVFGLPTLYCGITYRSRKEARFAVALTVMGIPFNYENMSFRRPDGGNYLPDFFLPRQQLYVELKPQLPHLEEERKCEEMSEKGYRIVLIYGENIECPPFRSEAQAKRESGSRDYLHKHGLRGMAWIDGNKLAGETVFVVGASPQQGGSPLQVMGDVNTVHLDQVCNTRDMRWNTSHILELLRVAGDEKFE